MGAITMADTLRNGRRRAELLSWGMHADIKCTFWRRPALYAESGPFSMTHFVGKKETVTVLRGIRARSNVVVLGWRY